MNKFTKILSLILLLYLSNCSFDKKSGIWTGSEEEKRKISNLEKSGKIINISAVQSDKYFTKEINSKKTTKLIPAQKNLSWPTSDLNLYNLKGNLYYPGSLKIIFKKKVGKKYT